MLEFLESRYKNTPNLEWDYNKDNIYALKKADIMISDFSGIIYDFVFLYDKPVIYVNHDFDSRPYDADDIEHELWQFAILREIGFELKEQHFSDIKALIKEITSNNELKTARKRAKDEAWQHQGEAAKRTVNFMIDYADSVSDKS
jgi:CDP-glycerol glycerophosphotransferase (TagB/SpsB family)